jgi:thiamine-phosphate pyrophosphorylase
MMLPRGLYAIADSGFGDPVAFGVALGAAGVRVIQLRAKGAPRAQVLVWAKALRAALPQVVLIANDDPTIARDAGFDGVHLGDDDPSVGDARAIVGPHVLIGRSTRTLEAVRRHQHADYLGFGPIFATTTRHGSPEPRGVELLAEAVRSSERPIVAIGGIGLGNVSAVQATGVHGWAVISALSGPGDLRDTLDKMSLRGTWTASRTLK